MITSTSEDQDCGTTHALVRGTGEFGVDADEEMR